MRSVLPILALLAPIAFAQNGVIPCGPGKACPESTPCCSQYGQCGVGAYCLGGCDAINSFSLDSCLPAPVCQSKTYNWDDLSGIVPNTKYLGDASKADWVSSGEPLSYNGNLLLTMAQGTVGTLLASAHYVWYGKISARLQTSAGKGVVTAFILLSDVKDEIDFEFVGSDLTTAQTNFYSLGITNYNNGGKTGGLSDTRANYHTYEIDWKPDSLTWSIDGNVVRTLNRKDTWNATANRYTFPQSPARVQLSLWPAGLASNGEGTIEWAGGLISWNSPYMQNNYYYAAFDSLSIQCYDPPSGANIQGKTSYVLTDKLATNASFEVTDKPTTIKSLLASGINTTADYPNSGSSTSNSSEVATIPGLSGAGPGTNGQRGASDTSSSGSGSGGSGTTSSTSSSSSGFVQNSDGQKNSAQGTYQPENVVQGSLFAVIVAIVGLCIL